MDHIYRLNENLEAVRGGQHNTEAAVDVLISTYKEAAQMIKDKTQIFKTVQSRAKELITEIIIETGQDKWKTEAGQIYIPKPGASVKYDPKALDALCASNPHLKDVLWPHRKVTERPGSLTIR